jgi:hypothetical protein
MYVNCEYHTVLKSIRVTIFDLRHCKFYSIWRKHLCFHKWKVHRVRCVILISDIQLTKGV